MALVNGTHDVTLSKGETNRMILNLWWRLATSLYEDIGGGPLGPLPLYELGEAGEG